MEHAMNLVLDIIDLTAAVLGSVALLALAFAPFWLTYL
jgi:hypothetical protein